MTTAVCKEFFKWYIKQVLVTVYVPYEAVHCSRDRPGASYKLFSILAYSVRAAPHLVMMC